MFTYPTKVLECGYLHLHVQWRQFRLASPRPPPESSSIDHSHRPASAHPDPDADAYPETHAQTHSHAQAHSKADPEADTQADSGPDGCAARGSDRLAAAPTPTQAVASQGRAAACDASPDSGVGAVGLPGASDGLGQAPRHSRSRADPADLAAGWLGCAAPDRPRGRGPRPDSWRAPVPPSQTRRPKAEPVLAGPPPVRSWPGPAPRRPSAIPHKPDKGAAKAAQRPTRRGREAAAAAGYPKVDPVAPSPAPFVPAPALAIATSADAIPPAPSAALTEPFGEALMPRWRRPSLKTARYASPRIAAAPVPNLTFAAGATSGSAALRPLRPRGPDRHPGPGRAGWPAAGQR